LRCCRRANIWGSSAFDGSDCGSLLIWRQFHKRIELDAFVSDWRVMDLVLNRRINVLGSWLDCRIVRSESPVLAAV
jgi:hypothetical protein